MDTPTRTHRRDRQQTRRFLAHLRTQCRDLPRSSFALGEHDLDFVGDRHRLRFFPYHSTDRSGY
jgi:hypothetical protein